MREWQASLNLRTELKGSVTRLTAARHEGPLRVQRPFQQRDGSCHIYMLHPPGGLVGGDSLNVTIFAGTDTHTVVTTPAAGKHYGCLPEMPQQIVRQTMTVGPGAFFEWVPQESIFFNKTNASVYQTVNLDESSRYLGWEILTLGRRASGEDFSGGNLCQSVEIRVAGRLIHRERLQFSESLQNAVWGLDSHSVVGTLVAFNLSDSLDEIRGQLSDPEWGVTQKGCTLLVRYVGSSAEDCREGFFGLRDLLSRSDRPRIWKT